MKRFWFALVLVAALLPIKLAAANDDTITLAVGEWEPFISEALPENGPILEIVSRAFALNNTKVEYRFLPWKRALKMSKKAQFAGTAVWGKNDERAADFHYSDVVLTQKDALFFTHKSLIAFDSADDFKGLKTGVLLGAYVGDELAALVERGELAVKEFRTYADMFKSLLKGRVDFIYMSELAGQTVLETEFADEQRAEVVARDSFEPPYRYYLLVPKMDADGLERVKAFNSGLKELRESGEYDRILAKAYQQG